MNLYCSESCVLSRHEAYEQPLGTLSLCSFLHMRDPVVITGVMFTLLGYRVMLPLSSLAFKQYGLNHISLALIHT